MVLADLVTEVCIVLADLAEVCIVLVVLVTSNDEPVVVGGDSLEGVDIAKDKKQRNITFLSKFNRSQLLFRPD